MTDPGVQLVVPARFNGPRASGNGGWTSGALAELAGIDGPATVSLRRPPPLDTPLPLSREDGWTVASLDGTTVARVRAAEHRPPAVEPVSAQTARAAESSYAGLDAHPFPTCFTCGTDRASGDGLRIHPGRVEDSPSAGARLAATWTPHPSLDDGDGLATVPATWAAMDCIGGWTSDLIERPMVLGEITIALDARPRVGETYVVVAAARHSEGRKVFASVSLYDTDGHELGSADQLWIVIDPATFG